MVCVNYLTRIIEPILEKVMESSKFKVCVPILYWLGKHKKLVLHPIRSNSLNCRPESVMKNVDLTVAMVVWVDAWTYSILWTAHQSVCNCHWSLNLVIMVLEWHNIKKYRFVSYVSTIAWNAWLYWTDPCNKINQTIESIIWHIKLVYLTFLDMCALLQSREVLYTANSIPGCTALNKCFRIDTQTVSILKQKFRAVHPGTGWELVKPAIGPFQNQGVSFKLKAMCTFHSVSILFSLPPASDCRGWKWCCIFKVAIWHQSECLH